MEPQTSPELFTLEDLNLLMSKRIGIPEYSLEFWILRDQSGLREVLTLVLISMF